MFKSRLVTIAAGVIVSAALVGCSSNASLQNPRSLMSDEIACSGDYSSLIIKRCSNDLVSESILPVGDFSCPKSKNNCVAIFKKLPQNIFNCGK